MRNYSLRGVLLITLLSASILILCITAYKSYKDTRKEIAELLDAELAQSARVINAFVKIKSLQQSFSEAVDTLEKQVPGHKYEKKVSFQLWTQHQQDLIIRSTSAPSFPLSEWHKGFSETQIGKHLWHVFSLPAKSGEYIIHVAQRHDIRQELTDDISKRLIKPLLIGIPVLGIAIWIIVGRSLRSINRLADQINKRKASKLEPLSTQQLPIEILPLVNAQNQLFVHLIEAFEKERRFTADASHELRTPLAGLLSQAQVALKTPDAVVRQRALNNIEIAVKRMSHLVQQLLTLARIDPSTDFLESQPTDLIEEIRQVINTLEHHAHAKHITLALHNDSSPVIAANPQLISILIRNIIDNAIQYTPEQGQILINIRQQQNVIEFVTEDSGHGIDEQLYQQVLNRFYRCVETANTTQGSGLGLSIVEQIAKSHRANLSLARSQFGGLKITIAFLEDSEKTLSKQ